MQETNKLPHVRFGQVMMSLLIKKNKLFTNVCHNPVYVRIIHEQTNAMDTSVRISYYNDYSK